MTQEIVCQITLQNDILQFIHEEAMKFFPQTTFRYSIIWLEKTQRYQICLEKCNYNNRNESIVYIESWGETIEKAAKALTGSFYASIFKYQNEIKDKLQKQINEAEKELERCNLIIKEVDEKLKIENK